MAFLPNLFILGAAKCGTTTLWSHLASVPDVCMSSPKEPVFFASEFSRGVQFYQEKYFRHWRNERVVGEASHRNLYLPYVASRIHKINHASKLIVMLRNPVERAYSHWWHYHSRGRDELTFDQAVRRNAARLAAGITPDCESVYIAGRENDRGGWNRGTYLDSGYYFQQLNRYRELFPDGQLKVILLEDLRSRPYEVMRSVHEFLDCRPINPLTFRLRRKNEQARLSRSWRTKVESRRFTIRLETVCSMLRRCWRIGRRPRMDEKTRCFLRAHYADHNRQLGDWLGRDLSHWQ